MQRFTVPITLDHLRRYAVARSFFKPTTLQGVFQRVGFVQADPIRAPARGQDFILRHRANLVVMRYRCFGAIAVIGRGNLQMKDKQLNAEFGYIAHRPRDRVFKRELDAELDRIKAFLAIG